MSDKYCVLQDDLKDCGVCSLLSIIKYYHGDVSKEYLRELTRTTKDGVNALNLLKAARELGFEAYGINGKIKDIKDNNLPVIAHVNFEKKYSHFIVLYKIDHRKNKILVMDPARGYIYISFSNFINISTGYFLILKPKQLIPKLVEENNVLNSIKTFFLKNKHILLFVMIMSISFTLINVIDSYHFKLFLDEKLDNTLLIFAILLILILFKYFINLLRNNLINYLNSILDKELIYKAYYHIINLPYLYFKNHTNGDLLTRINDLGNIKELISNLFISIFVDLNLAVFLLIVMLKINVKLTLIIFLCLIIYIGIVLISNKILSYDIRENISKASMVNNYLMESLLSFETIKNLSLQKYIFNTFQKKYYSYNQNKEELLKKNNNIVFLKNIVLSTCHLLIIYYGTILINNKVLTISSLITFITLSNYLIEPVKKILDSSILFLSTKESIRRIKELYQICEEDIIGDKRKNIKSLKGNVSINDLSYSYNGVDNIFNKYSMEIEEGQKVLISGNSGCGKSTLMKLIIKYINNNYYGNIFIDGHDLKDIDINVLRRNICYVSQQEYLYTDSVYENIVLGRKIKYEVFLNHAKNLFIDEIVSKSVLGYNYLIENNGENISGGERMRIIIARSIIYSYNIYIYDETFSEIDPMKERLILKYLFGLYPDKTFIIISHRNSNIDLYDKTIKFGDVIA